MGFDRRRIGQAIHRSSYDAGAECPRKPWYPPADRLQHLHHRIVGKWQAYSAIQDPPECSAENVGLRLDGNTAGIQHTVIPFQLTI